MTEAEYREFKRDLVAAFPRLFQWVNSECPSETRDATQERWKWTLCQHDLVDARAALNHFYAHPEALDRKRLETYIPIIAAEAGRIGAKRKFAGLDAPPRYVNGEQAFSCLLCRDYGAKLVWSETSKRVAGGKVTTRQDGKPQTLGEKFTLYTMAVACTCEAGSRWDQTNPQRETALLPFDQDRHLPVLDMSDPDEQAALIEFVRPKGHPEFAAFAGGEEG